MSKKRKSQKPKRRKSSQAAAEKKPQAPALSESNSKRNKFPLIAGAVIVVSVIGFFWWYQAQMAALEKQNQASTDNGSQSQGDTINNANQTTQSSAGGIGWETDGDRQAEWNRIDNASEDGWQTEVLNERFNDVFSKIKKLVTDSKPIDLTASGLSVSNAFSITSLRPEQLETVYDDGVVNVERGVIPTSLENESNSGTVDGSASFAEALENLRAVYTDARNIRLKIKVFRIEKDEEQVTTHQSFEIFGPTDNGILEENGVWRAEWNMTGGKPELLNLSISQYESAKRSGGTLFSDCTQSVIGANESFQQQLLRGYNYWLERSQFQGFFSILGNPGVAVGDVNGDGLHDLYVCQEAGLPNLLFIQNPDGTLRDASKESGANWLQNSTTALILDLNNDGHQDIAVGVTGGVVVASGDGTGTFKIETVLDSSDDVMSLTAADFDLDGWLDLYAGVYNQDGLGTENEDVALGGTEFVYYDANDGGRNGLFRSQCQSGKWQFQEVTEQVGLDHNNRRWTLAAAWEDFDNDGDQDLYVANDYGLNNLYRNDLQEDGSRVFVDIAKRN